MKATGIVRRIDDLGRVVVPKEIRRTLRIREGDPMEIFTDREGEIILKKYSPIGEIGVFSQQYADAVQQATKHNILVTDRDQIIAAAGLPKKELVGTPIHSALEQFIHQRQNLLCKKSDRSYVELSAVSSLSFPWEAISTIICEGDAIGAVILVSEKEECPLGDDALQIAATGAYFLGKQLEN